MARFSTAFGLCLFFLSFPSRSRSPWRTWGPRQASPLDTTILKSAVVFLTSEAFQLLSVRCGSAQGISRGSLPRSCWTVPTNATRSTYERHYAAHRRGLCDDAMGFGD